MPFYVNPPFADIVTTTREHRSAEHASLFIKGDQEKLDRHIEKPKPHIQKHGKYKIRVTPSGKYK